MLNARYWRLCAIHRIFKEWNKWSMLFDYIKLFAIFIYHQIVDKYLKQNALTEKMTVSDKCRSHVAYQLVFNFTWWKAEGKYWLQKTRFLYCGVILKWTIFLYVLQVSEFSLLEFIFASHIHTHTHQMI